MSRSRTTSPVTGSKAAIGDDAAAAAAAAAAAPSSPQSCDTEGNFKSTRIQLTPDFTTGDDTCVAEKEEVNDGEANNDKEAEKEFKLYKSPRLQSYLMILLSSVINYHSITVSQDSNDISAVVPSREQVRYGLTVAMVSTIITGVAVLFHMLSWFTYRCDCRVNQLSLKLFAPRSKIELVMSLFLLLWWFIATCVQTGVRGIAGDGKEQYNIYYSTWFCALGALHCAQSKWSEFGFPTFNKFLEMWPNRAPGWIGIFVVDFFLVFWYVDLFVNTYRHPERVADSLKPFWGEIPERQYTLLILVSCTTLIPSAGFALAEILRKTSKTKNIKSSSETNAEGISLLLLTLAWIPSVIVATTPGGLASYIGNTYFFTWATTVLVLQTTMWFIRDWRGGVHATIMQKEQEYRQHQQDVLEATRKLHLETMSQQNQDNGEEQDQRDSDYQTMRTERKDTDDAPIFGLISMLSGEEPVSLAEVKDEVALGLAVEDPEEQNDNRFKLRNMLEVDDVLDNTIQQERRMREANQQTYFDTLDDILE
jgi:hypothetical protein